MPTDLDWLRRIDPLRGANVDGGIEVPDASWVATHVTRRAPHRRSGWMALAAAVMAGAIALGLVLTGVSAPPKAAAIMVTQHDGAFIVTIREPLATAQDLARAFAEHHVDVSVQLIPVSPSEVGQIITFDGPGGGDIHPIATPTCPIGTPTCPITLSISHVVGHSSVVVGRAARPGERYASGANVFLPGEVLHCSGLLNATVAQAKAYLRAHHLVGTFRQEPSTPTGGSPSSTTTTIARTTAARTTALRASGVEYVVDGMAMSSRDVKLWVSTTPLSDAQVSGHEGGAHCMSQ